MGRPGSGSAAAWLAIALLGAPPAWGGPPPELWPLHVRDAEAVAGLRAARFAGPLFQRFEHADGRRGWALAPLLSSVHGPDRTQVDLLYPLGSYRRGADGSRWRLTPLLDVDPPSWTFVLAFGGRTDAGQGYLGLFPLGGVAKQRFGRERIDFWLFPLFARSRDHRGFTRNFVLWPFLSWGSGGGRRLLRIWPLYGRDERAGGAVRSFALWPLVHWQREPHGAGEKRTRFVLPFYGERVTPHARSRFVLAPLYADSENRRSGARSRSFLWPLFHFASSPPRDGASVGTREVRMEPFFRQRRKPERVTTGTLLGAVQRTVVSREAEAQTRWRWLWVSRFERAHQESGLARIRRDLWPLFRYDDVRPSNGPRRGELRFPWLLPVRGEGWDRSWLEPITLYQSRWLGPESRSEALWGAWRRRRLEGSASDVLGGVLRFDHPN